MSEYLQKIVYLTDSQYATLAGGGTVGSLTGLNDSYIYMTDGKVSLTDFDSSFVLPVSLGGTGASSWASGKILVGNGSSTFSTIDKATANTASTLVQRDVSGNFSAGTITMTQGNIGSMTLETTAITGLTKITTTGGNGFLAYKPSSWTGVTSSQWGVGTVDVQGVIRSSNSDLLHSRNGTNTKILDAGNVSPSITVGAGTGSAAPTINVTVGGVSGATAASITTASTSVYGVTKLSAAANDATLAATAKSVYDLAARVGNGSQYYLAYYSTANNISGHGLAHFSDTYSSSTKNGKNELVLGNTTDKASNGSAYGQLALYSPGTKGTYLATAENSTAWYTATLQAKTGTIAYTSDITDTVANYLKLDGTNTMTGSINMTKAGECGLEVNNTQTTNPHKVAFIVGSSGNGGIYDRTKSKWIVYSDPSGNVTLNGNANTATTAGNVTGTVAIAHGGTGLTSADPHKVLIGPSTGTAAAAPTWRAIVAADLPSASTSAAGIIQIGTSASNAMAGNTVVTNVYQSESTTASWRKVLLSANTYSAYNTAVGDGVSGQVYDAVDVSVQPSTGSIRIAGSLQTGSTINAGGIISAKENQYADSYSGAINMNNSNIYGLNSIYTSDSAGSASEGIHFYRTASTVDTLWISSGNIYFVPNRTITTDNTTSVGTTAANSEKVLRLPATITGSRVVYSDGSNGKLAESSVTSTELGYLSGVTSAIQTQINGKANSSHGNHVPTTQTADNLTFLRNDNSWYKLTTSAFGEGTADAGQNTFIIAGHSSDNNITTLYKRKLSHIVTATNVKTALGTDSSTTNQWLNKKGLWSTPTASDIGAVAITDGVTSIAWSSNDKKITRTINDTSSDVVTFVAGSDIELTATSTNLTIAAINQRVEIVNWT